MRIICEYQSIRLKQVCLTGIKDTMQQVVVLPLGLLAAVFYIATTPSVLILFRCRDKSTYAALSAP